jgi:hypothetical protein
MSFRVWGLVVDGVVKAEEPRVWMSTRYMRSVLTRSWTRRVRMDIVPWRQSFMPSRSR